MCAFILFHYPYFLLRKWFDVASLYSWNGNPAWTAQPTNKWNVGPRTISDMGQNWGPAPAQDSVFSMNQYLRMTVLKISASSTKSLWVWSFSKERSLICRIPVSFGDVICLKSWIWRISENVVRISKYRGWRGKKVKIESNAKEMEGVGKDAGKKEPSYTAGGNGN
jgi:hypothetical protein